MERPIILKDHEVRAIIEGRQTVLRRIAKPHGFNSILSGDWSDAYVLHQENHSWLMEDSPCDPGDSLWVRETWAHEIMSPDEYPILVYRADGASHYTDGTRVSPKMLHPYPPRRWRPSIFMPRWASRLSLEVLSVRLERLQDITEWEAIAEGIEQNTDDPCQEFRILWDSLNAKRGFGWDANPWVWRIEFRKGGAK